MLGTPSATHQLGQHLAASMLRATLLSAWGWLDTSEGTGLPHIAPPSPLCWGGMMQAGGQGWQHVLLCLALATICHLLTSALHEMLCGSLVVPLIPWH